VNTEEVIIDYITAAVSTNDEEKEERAKFQFGGFWWSLSLVKMFTRQWVEFSFYFTFLSLVERTSSPHVRLREQTACLGLTERVCYQMVLFK
jgi:hypothetical protein